MGKTEPEFDSPEWKKAEDEIRGSVQRAREWAERRYVELSPAVDSNLHFVHREDLTYAVTQWYDRLREKGGRNLRTDPWLKDEEEIGLMPAMARWIVSRRLLELEREAASRKQDQ